MHSILNFRKEVKVEAQKTIDVYYQTQLVGKYEAELIVNDLIILEYTILGYKQILFMQIKYLYSIV